MEELATTPLSASLPAAAEELLDGPGRPGSGSFAYAYPGGNRPLPLVPHSASGIDITGLQVIRARKGSLSSMSVPLNRDPGSFGAANMQASSHHRQHSRNLDDPMAPISRAAAVQAIIDGLPASSIPFPGISQRSASSTNPSPVLPSEVFEARARTRSQPETRLPQLRRQSSQSDLDVPSSTLSSVDKSASISSQPNHGLRINTDKGSLAPLSGISTRSTPSTSRSLPPLPNTTASAAGSLISPLPEAQPSDIIHRPFHLLRILHSSMDPESSGSYLTGAIHISSPVWKPSNRAKASSKALAPPKITAQDVKVRCIEALLLHFEIIRKTGSGLFDGPKDGRYGARPGLALGTAGKRVTVIAEEFCGALDGLDEEMDQGYKALMKGGVSVGGWKGKKTGVSKFRSGLDGS